MNHSIDFASPADLDMMADLLAELFTLESDFKPAREKQISGLRQILENPQCGQLFVVRAGENVIGMANALITVSTAEGCNVVLLEDVIIKGDFRRQQLGRRLIDHVIDWAIANGMPRITLLADQNNVPALNFYKQMGFCASTMRVLRMSTA